MLKLTNKYEVLTPNGWDNFDGINQTESQYLIKITLENKLIIRVTPNHQFVVNNINVTANDLQVFDVIQSKTGLTKIMNIEREIDEKNLFKVYDLYNVNNIQRAYYTNNVISHNCCDFILSGETAIDAEIIEWIKQNYMKEPIDKQGQDKDFWIWKYPETGRNYIIGADVCKGDGSDYASAQIICVETLEQVAEFKAKVDAERLGALLCKWGIDYNNALLVPENNNFGQRTIQKILDLNYTNLFWFDKRFKGLVFSNSAEEPNQDKKEPGFPTTGKTRPLMLENLIKYINELVECGYRGIPGGIIIHSSRLITEFNSWGWFNGRLDHAKGKHDDLIIAIAIACFISTVYKRISDNGNNTVIEFMKFFSNDKQKIDASFGLYTSGKNSGHNPYITPQGEDISFLVK